jgi:serum/glucocorticoid-regulated kinase 2
MNPSVICIKILNSKLTFPSGINLRTKEFVTALLQKQPSKRLGSGQLGTKELCNHSYFRELDFDILERKKYSAPWKPEIKNELDTSNFDDYPFDKSVTQFTGGDKKIFKDF